MSQPEQHHESTKPPLSFAALALSVVSTAVAVLILTVAAVYFVPDNLKLVVVIVGIIAMIGSMAVVSTMLTNRVIRHHYPDIDEQ